jgi:ubiquinone/menaquinone biosynthesis C-methylase UbiE
MTKILGALLLATLAAAPASAQNNASDAALLIEKLQLKPGATVAEIGAGGGELTIALAKHVGADGVVYTSELGSERLATLRAAVAKSGVANIHVVEGRAEHANLPEGCCDAVFMRNVYHHFGDPATMNASLFKALKSGGRLAVIDFSPRNNAPIAAPGKRGEDQSHGVNTEVLSNELKAAGFEIVTAEDRGERWFIVVGAKPR